MENILEKCYQDLLKSDLLPEDLVVYERKKIHQIIERISKDRKVGDFLLKDGTSVTEAPTDISQIEGIWLSENCVAAPCLSKKKLSFDEAKKFFEAETKFNIVIADVNRIIGEVIKDVMQ